MSGDVAENRIPEGALCLRGRKSLPQGRVLLPRKRSIWDAFCLRVNSNNWRLSDAGLVTEPRASKMAVETG
ncbi:hypothetical protein Gotur_027086 [Gossypium turneri]